MPRFSILVTCYNAEEFIAECIESVKAQTVGDWECLIGDDASTDGTAGKIEKSAGGDPKFRVFRRWVNMGGGENLRCLMECAAGDICVELGGDDFLLPDALERIAREYDTYPECEATSGSFVMVPGGGVAASKPDLFWWKRWSFCKTLTWKTALGTRALEEMSEIILDPETGLVPRYGWDVSIYLPIVSLVKLHRTIHDITYAYRRYEGNDQVSHRADQIATERRVCDWLDARLMPHVTLPWLKRPEAEVAP